MNFKVFKYFSLTAALLSTTNLCFAMDPPPEQPKTRTQKQSLSSPEDQDIVNSTHSFPLSHLENAVKNYYKKNLDEGFEALCAYIREPESTIDSTTSLLQEIFKEHPKALPHWLSESSATLLSWMKSGEDESVSKFFFSPLNALRLNRQNGNVPQLNLNTTRLLATLNWNASQQPSDPLNKTDNKSYKEEAVRYYIVCAKSGDEEALSRLRGQNLKF